MPSECTFQSLQDDLRAYLQRGAITDPLVYTQLPKLINNAERRIARDLKVLGFQQPLTGTMQAGVPVIPKPDRWRSTVSFNYGSVNSTGLFNIRNPLFPRSYEYVRSYWTDDNVVQAPKFYADYDWNNWLIAPTPDQAYPFEVTCWMLPSLLDINNQTNWTSIYVPDILLYASLLECAPFIVNDERIPVWEAGYAKRLEGLSDEDKARIVDRSAVRTTP